MGILVKIDQYPKHRMKITGPFQLEELDFPDGIKGDFLVFSLVLEVYYQGLTGCQALVIVNSDILDIDKVEPVFHFQISVSGMPLIRGDNK
jgi:hypothetical protein